MIKSDEIHYISQQLVIQAPPTRELYFLQSDAF